MATLTSWLRAMTSLGNAGAVANAQGSCRQWQESQAATDAALDRLLARLATPAGPVRQSA